MKKRELKELRDANPEELKARLSDRVGEAERLRIAIVTGEEKNAKVHKAARRDIAQIKTLMNEKSREVAKK